MTNRTYTEINKKAIALAKKYGVEEERVDFWDFERYGMLPFAKYHNGDAFTVVVKAGELDGVTYRETHVYDADTMELVGKYW